MKFKLTILGSGGAIPTVQKKPTSQFLNVQERYFLIDCGEGTQIQLRKYACKFQKIDNIFISHLHGDHYLGLIGFLSSLNLLGRNRPINVYAPEKLKKILDVHQEVNGRSFDYEIVFHPLTFNDIALLYEDTLLKIFSFPVLHSVSTCGFLFKEKKRPRNLIKEKISQYKIPVSKLNSIKLGNDFIENEIVIKNSELTISPYKERSYAYCADTLYDEKILKYIKNVDLLYHEATFLSPMLNRAKSTKHSTAEQAALIAKKAMVDKLLIGHFSSRYKDIKLFESEAKNIFEPTVAVSDGDQFEIPLKQSNT